MICSIRACAVQAKFELQKTGRRRKPCDCERTSAAWPRELVHWRYCWAPRRRWPIPTPQIRRHARDRHGLSHIFGAVLGPARDWNWKQNHDTGQFYEQLFAADLSKSVKNGGPHPFYADAWLPSDAIRGELAESWEWKDNPLRIEIKLRKGIMFPEKPGVMPSRELVAEDVVFSYTRLATSPKKIATYFDHVDKVYAADKHTVVFQFNAFNAEWDYRFGWGYYSGVMPKEVADAGAANWKNVNGTGPFMLGEFVQGNSNTYVKNPNYWGKDKVNGGEYKLPFVDKLVFRTIKDEATYITALRTGKIDMLESIRWQNVEQLKKSAPAAQVVEVAQHVGHLPRLTCRYQAVRRHPRAARAQHGGQQAGDRLGLLQWQRRAVRLSAAPRLQGLFRAARGDAGKHQGAVRVRPDKAKKLLAEAGHPNGFSFKVQVCSCNPDHMDLLPLIAAYLEKVGVKIEIQPMEYGAFLSAMTTQNECARLLHEQRPHQPDHHHPQELHHGPGVEPVAV